MYKKILHRDDCFRLPYSRPEALVVSSCGYGSILGSSRDTGGIHGDASEGGGGHGGASDGNDGGGGGHGGAHNGGAIGDESSPAKSFGYGWDDYLW